MKPACLAGFAAFFAMSCVALAQDREGDLRRKAAELEKKYEAEKHAAVERIEKEKRKALEELERSMRPKKTEERDSDRGHADELHRAIRELFAQVAELREEVRRLRETIHGGSDRKHDWKPEGGREDLEHMADRIRQALKKAKGEERDMLLEKLEAVERELDRGREEEKDRDKDKDEGEKKPKKDPKEKKK